MNAIIPVSFVVAALYFLNKNKSNNSAKNTANKVVEMLKPVTYSNYGYYSNYNKKEATTATVFKPSTPGIDGTPYKDSPLYFGDKTKPYDSFYDYSDDLSRLYIGYINENKTDREETKYNAVRYRIVDRKTSVFHWIWVSGAGYYDTSYMNFINNYLVLEAFNPFNYDINLRTLTPTSIKSNDIETRALFIDKIKTIEKLDNFEKGVTFSGAGAEYISLDPINVNVHLPSRTPVFFNYQLGAGGVERIIFHKVISEGFSRKNPNKGNFNFELMLNAQYGNYDVKYPVSFFCYPEKPVIIPEKFWQLQIEPTSFFVLPASVLFFPNEKKAKKYELI